MNRRLSLSDRLKLVALILKALTQSSIEVVDQSDDWTEQDQIEISRASLDYANALYPESEELI